MPTYDENLAATEQSATPECYEVQAGPTTYRYTSYSEDLSFLGYTWEKQPIKRSGIRVDNKIGVVSTSIYFPATSEFLQYIANQPPATVSIRIYRVVLDDLNEYSIKISGRVNGIGFKDRTCQVLVKSKGGVLDNTFPNMLYKVGCNNNIFDAGCGLSESAYRKSTVIDSISGSQIISVAGGFSQYTSGWLVSGRVYTDIYNYRLITYHSGNTIKVHVPFASTIVAGATVYFTPGCNNGDPVLCDTRFGNLHGSGGVTGYNGMASIPSQNPVVWGF